MYDGLMPNQNPQELFFNPRNPQGGNFSDLPSSGKKKGRPVLVVFSVLAALFLTAGGFLVWKIFVLEKKISQEVNFGQGQTVSGQKESTLLETTKNWLSNETAVLRGGQRDRINLLLLGMGGEGHKGKYLTDTIMLVSINPRTYQTAFLSIPRDLYVKIPETSIHTKINAVYAYETENGRKTANQPLETLKKLIQEITGQPIDYYLALDFDGFKKIIDDLGGIEVEVVQDIHDERYPGPNFSYQTFSLEKGFHHLDGETALKYARVRHVAGGDFGRAKRQQEVLIAAKNKAFSREVFLNPSKVLAVMNDLGEHLRTDISLEEIPAFWELAKNVNVYQATTRGLDAWSENALLASSHILLGGQNAYVLLPREKNYFSIQTMAENIFDLNFLERQKAAIAKENPSVALFSAGGRTERALWALKKMGYNQNKLLSKRDLPGQVCSEKSLLYYKKESASKLFSLDRLAKGLEIEVAELAADVKLEQDFLLCLTERDWLYFSQQNQEEAEEDEALKEKSVLGPDGQILINQE